MRHLETTAIFQGRQIHAHVNNHGITMNPFGLSKARGRFIPWTSVWALAGTVHTAPECTPTPAGNYLECEKEDGNVKS